jgi:hypothetical protein
MLDSMLIQEFVKGLALVFATSIRSQGFEIGFVLSLCPCMVALCQALAQMDLEIEEGRCTESQEVQVAWACAAGVESLG